MDIDAERRLMEEGAKSYVAAEDAVRAFRGLIQTRFRDVVLERLKEYSTALDKELETGDVEDHSYSYQIYRDVGVKIRLGGYNELGHVLTLSQDDKEPLWVSTYLYVYNRKRFDRVCNILRPLSRDLDIESKAIFFAKEIQRDEICGFQEKLEQIFDQWIDLWKRAGGLAIIAKTIAEAED